MFKRLLQAIYRNKLSPGKTRVRKRLVVFLCVVVALTSSAIMLAGAPGIILTASWYSVDSLKDEGTYKQTKGVMANGKRFNDNKLTCATRLYPLGSLLRVTHVGNGKSIKIRVTDRIGKRFAKTRIDLSKLTFSRFNKLEKGIVSVRIKRIK